MEHYASCPAVAEAVPGFTSGGTMDPGKFFLVRLPEDQRVAGAITLWSLMREGNSRRHLGDSRRRGDLAPALRAWARGIAGRSSRFPSLFPA